MLRGVSFPTRKSSAASLAEFFLSWTRAAVDSLEEIRRRARTDAERILNASDRFGTNPSPDGKHVKKLKGYEELYRLRVGGYRLIYQRRGNQVPIVEVLRKPEFEKRY